MLKEIVQIIVLGGSFGDLLMISIIALTVVLFIALCATVYMYLNQPSGLIAGEPIERGSLVYIGEDGHVYMIVYSYGA